MITCDQCRSELAEHALATCPRKFPRRWTSISPPAPSADTSRRRFAAAWSALPMAPPSRRRQTSSIASPRASTTRRQRGDKSLTAASADAIIPAGRNASPLTSRQRLLSYVLAASLFIGLSLSFVRLTQPSRDDAVAIAAIQELAERLGKLQRREADRLLQSEHFRLASLHGPETPDSAQAYVVWDLMGKQWHFYASDLPPAPAGRLTNSGRLPVRRLSPRSDVRRKRRRTRQRRRRLPQTLAPRRRQSGHHARTARTLEGSEQPSGKTILEATL